MNESIKKNLFVLCAYLLVGYYTAVFGEQTQHGKAFLIDVLEEGLPQRSVISIYQSRNGYLWFGTLNGLVRYDSVNLDVIDEAVLPVLGDARIIRIFEDSRTNLWVATDGGRVVCIKPTGFLGFTLSKVNDRVTSIVESSFERVWLYTAHGELFQILGTNVTVWEFGAQYSSMYRGLMVEDGQLLWIGVDWGMYGFDVGSTNDTREIGVLRYVIPTRKLDYMVSSRQGGYWRLADGRIQRWNTNALLRDYGPYPWKYSARVSTAIEDSRGCLVVGTINENDGVYWMQPDGKWIHISVADGLSHDGVLSLWQDLDGILWVGTDGGGVNKIRPRIFQLVPESRDWVIQSVCSDSDGGLWIGFGGGGVMYWDGKNTRMFGPNQGLWNQAVRSIVVDRDGQVWVGTLGGLFRLRGDHFEIQPLPGALSPSVNCMYLAPNGTLWVGTSVGLYVNRNGDWERFNLNGMPPLAITAVVMDTSTNLWLGSRGGGVLKVGPDGSIKLWGITNGLPSQTVTALATDGASGVWVGTTAGLALIDDDIARPIPVQQGKSIFPFRGVNYLLLDPQGWLWIGSSVGLVRVDPRKLAAFVRGQTDFVHGRHYTRADGLPVSECSSGSQPAAAITPEGTLWFPTIKGLAKLELARLRVNTNPPPVVIRSIRLDGVDVMTNWISGLVPSEVVVKPGVERVELEFAALSFNRPDAIRFRYRLEGLENKWVEDSGNRQARYSRLAPGRYLFTVTACNEDGVLNPYGAQVWITVEPPFWRRWWFMVGSGVVAVAGLGGFVYWISAMRYKRRLRALEQQRALERERARIARDLHDQLGANLAQIALLGELIETSAELSEEVATHAKAITESARQTSEALDEIVWATNPAHDTLESLITYASKHFQEYLGAVGIAARLSVPSGIPSVYLPPEVRHNVYLALREAVTNVVKHSGASEAWMIVVVQSGTVTIEIRDNGRGFDPEKELLIGHDGLKNMNRRLAAIGGACRIISASGSGTRVVIQFRILENTN